MPPQLGFRAQTLLDQGRVSQESLNVLKTWCKSQKLPVLSDEQLVLFLLSCYNVVEAIQNTICAHFKCKSGAPELFYNRDLQAEDVQKAISVCYASLIPTRTRNNDAIIFGKLQDTSYSSFCLAPLVKLAFMIGELLLYRDPPDGLIVIIDLNGFGLLHLTKLKIGTLRNFFNFVQEGYACKITEIHVLNTVYFIEQIMFVLNPLMSKELYDKIKFHPTDMNMNEFFNKFLPRDCFPGDYGGLLPSLPILSSQTHSVFPGMKKFYKDEENQIEEYKALH